MSDTIARGMAAQALPYNPGVMQNLYTNPPVAGGSGTKRGPRVLVIGESILEDTNFLAKLQNYVPNAQLELRSYGGSLSSTGMLLSSTDVQAKISTGNLLTNSIPGSWAMSNCTNTHVNSPTSGRATFEFTCNGVSQQGITSLGNPWAVVPSPSTGVPTEKGTDGVSAPYLCFSVVIEPGTLQTFRITVYNQTASNNVIAQHDFTAAVGTQNRALLPAKYIVVMKPTGLKGNTGTTTWAASTAYSVGQVVIPTASNGFYYVCTTAGTSGATAPTWPTTSGATVTDGTAVWTAYPGYKVGDNISISIGPGADESWAAGTMYISQPVLNAGVFPAPYSQTSGTPQTASSGSWVSTDVGTNRRLFDLAVVQFGRNDSNNSPALNIPAVDEEQILSSIVNGISQYAARVMLITPPPMANSATPTAWAASDYYQTSGNWQAAVRVARKHGCYLYDAYTDFQDQVAFGKYQVSDIMRDQYHPTNALMTSPGMLLFISQIASVLNGTKDSPVRQLGNSPVARIGGDVNSGTWTWQVLTAGESPTSDPYGILIGHQKEPYIGAYMSNTANSILQFTITGSNIGLIIVNDKNTTGQMNVTVDGGPAYTINTSADNEVMFPLGQIVATGLTNTQHTVQVTCVSGTVYVQACVAS